MALFGLPTDLLREVFVRLALDDVKVFRRVSRQARDLADASKSQWREVNRHTVLSIKEAQRAAEMSAVLPAWSRFTAVPRERMRPTSSGASARPEPAMLTRRETSAITYEVCRNFLRSDASALRRVEAP